MGRLCKRPDTAEKPAGMVTICEIGAMSSEFLSIRLNSVDAVHRLNDDGRDKLSCLRYSRPCLKRHSATKPLARPAFREVPSLMVTRSSEQGT